MKQKSIAYLCLFCVCLSLTACFNRLNLREGIISFQHQDYRQAFIRLMPEAEKGQPDAQYAVGYMYYYGQGVVEDRQKAVYWISLAAKNGQPDANKAMSLLKKPGSGSR
ncbi:MAG: sel1 repeat family protein [Legionellaceae bacterium]|nr:sel1 repeat family protein [Legionellaceae bacterium]